MHRILLLAAGCAAHILESDELWEDHFSPGMFLMFFLLVLLGIGFCALYYCLGMHHRSHDYYQPTVYADESSSSSSTTLPPLRPNAVQHATHEVQRVHKGVMAD